MKTLSVEELRELCPLKWHDKIPLNGISLGVADVDFYGPIGAIQYITDSLEDYFAFYQNQSGLRSTIENVTRFMNKKNINAKSSNIQIIPGTMIGIYTAMKWVSRKPGKVITLGPIYEPIHRHATDNNNEIDWVEINADGLNTEELKSKISRETKMIAICNPTNPIGHLFKMDELNLIADLADEYNITCFSDELYEPLVFRNKKHISIGSIDKIRDNTVLLYGFSKAYGLAGFRSGFMMIGDNLVEEMKGIVNSQLVSPSPIASLICDYALTNDNALTWRSKFIKLMEENTEYATKRFQEAGYNCNIPESCFFIFPDIDYDDTKFTSLLLKEEGVQVVEGSKFGPMGKNHIRINCATSLDRLDHGIDKIISLLSTLVKK